MNLLLIANVTRHFLPFGCLHVSVFGQDSMWFVLGTIVGGSGGDDGRGSDGGDGVVLVKITEKTAQKNVTDKNPSKIIGLISIERNTVLTFD